MKKGFSLAEALITLGIISVIAALVLPMANNIKPNRYKLLYLQTHDSVAENIKALANNNKEFPMCGANSSGSTTYFNMTNYPLLNIYTSITGSISQKNGYSGITKLCKLMAWSFDAQSDSCSSTTTNVGANAPGSSYWQRSFVARNGIAFSIRPRVVSIGATSQYGMNIIFDVDGDLGQNCLYNSSSCKNPDRFWIYLTADGNLIPADAMGRHYINTRRSTNDNTNKTISESSVSWSGVEDTSFTTDSCL